MIQTAKRIGSGSATNVALIKIHKSVFSSTSFYFVDESNNYSHTDCYET